MPFNAGTAVDPMEYDFTAYGGTIGVVPEPSQKAFRAYTRKLTSLMAQFKEVGDAADKEDITAKELEVVNDKAEKLSDEFDAIVSELCQNKPAAEEVALLPYRVKVAFSKWLQEEFRPEAETSATKK